MGIKTIIKKVKKKREKKQEKRQEWDDKIHSEMVKFILKLEQKDLIDLKRGKEKKQILGLEVGFDEIDYKLMILQDLYDALKHFRKVPKT